MNVKQCRKCGGFYFADACGCSPHYVAIEEYDQTSNWKDGRRVPGSERLDFLEQWARSAVDAARTLVEARDEDRNVCGAPVHVVVISGSGPDRRILRFEVRAAVDINYWAAPTDTDWPSCVPDVRTLSAATLERWGVPE